MCVSKILHYSDHGCVSVCKECRRIQLCFGTTVTTHSENEFKDYCVFVKTMMKKYEFSENRFQKKIIIKTAVENLSLLYSANDLECLDELLSQSALLLSVHHVLDADASAQNN